MLDPFVTGQGVHRLLIAWRDGQLLDLLVIAPQDRGQALQVAQ